MTWIQLCPVSKMDCQYLENRFLEVSMRIDEILSNDILDLQFNHLN
ncbi:20321_t:CDS:2 [Gigaspora margarita]|uniref:20321_t:CDS:1 n=1 Tax=Gigaspora margarita TaxID=4874 RepID=A0ABN7UD88_GIGMA|nr:20321_t:CDS:2 [Gigaspora margarita]